MEHLQMQSRDMVSDNMKYIAERWPECLTEAKDENGKLRQVVDFDKLRQVLSADATGEGQERYQFTWPDKRHAIRLANAPITDTLRPCREESVDWNTTQNLYIEGDNLNVLKLLRESYLGKVKMIYIDPPYNTGGDFVYKDNFIKKNSDYAEVSGAYDKEGNLLVGELEKNADSNGRFHTDWLNMIYPRLKVARDLLSEDGVIFISIDDNEVENLRKVCDEVFGEGNSEILVWDTREAGTLPKTASKTVRNDNEFVVAIYKAERKLHKYSERKYLDKLQEWSNVDNDPRGPWMSANISRGSGESTGGSKSFIITNPNGVTFDRDWAISEDEYKQLLQDNRIYFSDNGNGVPRKKIFATDVVDSIQSSILQNLNSATSAGQELKKMFGGKFFDFPKPVLLIKRLVSISTQQDSLILDFFSGSATTAHAVMQLNAEDGGNRKFIMVQIPEATAEDSEVYKAGYKNICEIGKERIRRAGKKIKDESPLTTQDLDTGFRVLKLDSSNMLDVFYAPAETTQQNLFADNIKPDRTGEDLLMQVMMELGIQLSDKIETTEIAGKTVWNVSDGYLMACFDTDVNEDTIKAIAKQKPAYFVLADRSLASDNVADNFEQLFEEYSPDTVRRII